MELTDAEYNRRLTEFQSDLKQPAAEVVQKHILTGAPAALTPDAYFLLRKRVADKFRVQAVEVLLVGSCRLGFSVVDKPKLGRPRYSPMRPDSDLDLVVVSTAAFDQLWQELFHYEAGNRGYAVTPEAVKCRDNLFRGWIDPQGLPPVKQFARTRDWVQLFEQIGRDREYGNRRASARLYRSWDRLAAYQQVAVEQCKHNPGGRP